MRDQLFERSSEMLRTIGAALVILVMLAGCTASRKMMQIAKDPSTPVGELRDQPSLVALSVVAAKDMNPNVYQPVETGVTATGLPYSVSLSGDDLADLAQQLKVTLRQVRSELRANAVSAESADDVASDEDATSDDEASDEGEIHGQSEGSDGAPSTDNEDTAAETTRAADIEEHGDGVARQVGQYRAGHGGDDDDEQETPDERSSRNANPVEVTVYQLKDDGRFLGADFDLLHDDPKKALGKTYLDHDEFVVRPGQFKFVRFFPVKEQTQFIAVVASYEDIDSIVWKGIARIESTGGRYPLLVSLGRHGVSIQKED